jgi:hypothetical protein
MSESHTRENDPRKRSRPAMVWSGVFIILAISIFADWYPVIKFRSQKAELEHIAAKGRKWGVVQPDLIAAGFTIDQAPQYYGRRKLIDLSYRTPLSTRFAVMIWQLWRTGHFPQRYETLDYDLTFVIALDSAETVESIGYDAFYHLGL